MPFSLIPFFLLAIPLLEIAAFVVIGGEIGVFATLALVFVTAVLGSILLRVQGFGLLQKIRNETEAGRVPGRELVHGVMILVAGVLLLTPGFITDSLGFLLFVPAIRDAGWSLLKGRILFTGANMSAGGPGPRGPATDGRTIDLDADDYTSEPDPNSPWADDKRQ